MKKRRALAFKKRKKKKKRRPLVKKKIKDFGARIVLSGDTRATTGFKPKARKG